MSGALCSVCLGLGVGTIKGRHVRYERSFDNFVHTLTERCPCLKSIPCPDCAGTGTVQQRAGTVAGERA